MQAVRILFGCVCVTCCFVYARSYEEDCDYLDLSKKDHINHLQCHSYGCCGEFKTRYCCEGPILIVGAVFGSIVGVLILIVVVAVCYKSFKSKQKRRQQTIPVITAAQYDDIPLPSPAMSTPTVYNSSKLHPPPFTSKPFRTATVTPQSFRTATNTPQPFRNATNTPQPFRTATNTPQPFRNATNSPQPFRNATNSPQPFRNATNSPQPFRNATNTPQPFRNATNTPQPFRNATNTPQPFRNPDVFDGEAHPPPSTLHPPRLHVMPVSTDVKRTNNRFREPNKIKDDDSG